MNLKSLSIVTGLVATLVSGAALAADEYTLNQNLPTPVVQSSPRVVAVRQAAVDEYRRQQNPAVVATSDLQRAQVIAEAKEARRLGLITEGELQAPTPTAAQLEQIRLAGLRALSNHVAAK